jgi:hypothetical protein
MLSCSSAIFGQQRHVQAQALRFHAFGIRHTHAPMDFELLDVNTIDHDSWNFGEKDIRRRAPILIAVEQRTPGSANLLGRKRGHDFLETRIAAQCVKVRV